MSLAEALRRSNPDRALPNLPNGAEDASGQEVLPEADGLESAARLAPVAFSPTSTPIGGQ